MRLRPLQYREARQWRRLRSVNATWLGPWEATSPISEVPLRSYHQMVRELNRQGRAGAALPFAIEVDGALVGQLTVGSIIWGSLRCGAIGYWVDRAVAGRGIVPTAVAAAADYCLLELGLHRIEVNIRPENAASLRVVEKLGFRDEGLRRRYLHIDGAWRDHRTFALTVEDVPRGLLPGWREARHAADGEAAEPRSSG